MVGRVALIARVVRILDTAKPTVIRMLNLCVKEILEIG